MAALRLSTLPGMGMVMRCAAAAIRLSLRPAPSLPMSSAHAFARGASLRGVPSRATAAMAGMLCSREQVEGFCFGCVDGGNAKGGAGGGAECFGVPGTGGAWEQENAGGGEGFGRAEERADVAGVLQTGEDENERRLTAEERVYRREGRRVDERGDALGLLGGDGTGEDIGRQQEMFGVIGNCERRLVAVAQEDGGEAQMAADGLGDEVLAFDGNEPGGGAAGAGEGGAQLFDARVLAALDEAGACAEGAGGHRGDFTPLSALGAVSYASRAFSSCRFNRRMRLFRDGEVSLVYTYWKMFRMIARG